MHHHWYFLLRKTHIASFFLHQQFEGSTWLALKKCSWNAVLLLKVFGFPGKNLLHFFGTVLQEDAQTLVLI